MNREIKFRAWDKTYKRWIYLIITKESVANSQNPNEPRGEVTEWLQYTGLKDKNGVEIYEGDIVQHYQRKLDGRYKYGNPQPVEFVNTTNKAGWNITKTSIVEVIGNIYENLELLTKSNE